MAKKSSFTTEYDPKHAGTLAFSTRDDLERDIQSYLDIVLQLKEDFREDKAVVEGLGEIETSLNALRISQDAEEDVRKQMDNLVNVPFGGDKKLNLDSFRKSSSKSTLANLDEYRTRVLKLIRNTQGNITQLLLNWPDDSILQKFLTDLHEIEKQPDARVLKYKMSEISDSPQLWHYNERKKEYLMEWLRPYQELLGGSVDELSEEEIQAALAKVSNLRNTKLEEMTNLVMVDDRADFRIYNRQMHSAMNGKNSDFWGAQDVRDEFIGIMQKLLNRFSISLEDRFLLFKTQDGEFCFLVGFADDAFDNIVKLDDGNLGLYPHLKVFFKGQDGSYNEITEAIYDGDASAYYTALKTAVVPFVNSMSVMLEVELSDSIKEAFDMWT